MHQVPRQLEKRELSLIIVVVRKQGATNMPGGIGSGLAGGLQPGPGGFPGAMGSQLGGIAGHMGVGGAPGNAAVSVSQGSNILQGSSYPAA